MERKIFFSILISLSLLLFGCQRSPQLNEDLAEKDKTIAQLEDKVAQLEEQLQQLEEEVTVLEEHRTSTETFVRQGTALLPGESLRILAQLDWTYELSVNGVPIEDVEQVVLTDSSFTLTVAEKKNPNSILPGDISNMGKVTGSIFANHIQFPAPKPVDIQGNDTHLISSATYVFKDLEWGARLDFVFSQELQERLGRTHSTLTLLVPTQPTSTDTTAQKTQ